VVALVQFNITNNKLEVHNHRDHFISQR